MSELAVLLIAIPIWLAGLCAAFTAADTVAVDGTDFLIVGGFLAACWSAFMAGVALAVIA